MLCADCWMLFNDHRVSVATESDVKQCQGNHTGLCFAESVCVAVLPDHQSRVCYVSRCLRLHVVLRASGCSMKRMAQRGSDKNVKFSHMAFVHHCVLYRSPMVDSATAIAPA